jgi:flagellar biosynthesis/type III secretory pathway M-ring protein FliF/YscJ
VEILLFLLFMLFSVVSSLLERRKRKRELENARQAQGARSQRIDEEEEEEEVLGWPFGGGKDPFEDEDLSRRFGDLQRLGEQAKPKSEVPVVKVNAPAEERAPVASSRQRVENVLRERTAHSEEAYSRPARRAGRWRLDVQKAREAVVYAEILGPPKAMRSEER